MLFFFWNLNNLLKFRCSANSLTFEVHLFSWRFYYSV